MNIPYRHIAIEGNIGAGKTTLAKLLRNVCRQDLLPSSLKTIHFFFRFMKIRNVMD